LTKPKENDKFLYLGGLIMNKIVFYGFLLVSFIIFSSCEVVENGDLVIQMDKETFDKEYSAWELQNLRNYQFIYDFSNDAGPLGPVKITIKEDNPIIIENSNEYNDNIIATNITEIYEFINSTFDFIESVKNGTYSGFKIKNLTLTVKYNKQYHYPTDVNFSEYYEELVDGGGNYTLRITDFIK
jgi:hypothetical protein